jgi:hypothetical protein
VERLTPVRLSSPEALGLTGTKPVETANVDWTAVHHRLDQLGAACFQVERLPKGSCKIICLLPTSQPGARHRIEAQAASEAEAVRLTLAQAEEWVKTSQRK